MSGLSGLLLIRYLFSIFHPKMRILVKDFTFSAIPFCSGPAGPSVTLPAQAPYIPVHAFPARCLKVLAPMGKTPGTVADADGPYLSFVLQFQQRPHGLPDERLKGLPGLDMGHMMSALPHCASPPMDQVPWAMTDT